MKSSILAFVALCLVLAFAACQKEPTPTTGTLSGRVLVNDEPALEWRVRLERNGEKIDLVETDVEGLYRFANIAAGSYSLLAYTFVHKHMVGQRRVAQVKVGNESRMDIALREGDLELQVNLEKSLQNHEEGLIHLFGETVAIKTGAELFKHNKTTMALRRIRICDAKAPCTFSALSPGDYTACFSPLGMTSEQWQTQGPMKESFSKLRVCCLQLSISAAPESRAIAFQGCAKTES